MSAFTGHYHNGSIKYRVWIPEGVVPRGIVFASMGNNWDYRHFVDNPTWQAAARHWQFMLVGTGPKGAAHCEPARLRKDIETFLAQVAQDTGHAAIPRLPFCAYGLSFGGLFTRNLAAAWPERTIAGGIGGMVLIGNDPVTKQDVMPDPAVKEIPFMITIGELDTWAAEHWKKYFPLLRKEGFRIALAYQWGLSHYEGNYENIMLIHFDRAIQHRLPAGWRPDQGAVTLRSIAIEDGWMASGTNCGNWGTLYIDAFDAKHAPGNQADYSWFVDQTMARAWQAYSLRHNAAMLVRPWSDSVDYIASRSLPAPLPAGKPIAMQVMAYWPAGSVKADFYANLERIGTATETSAGPGKDAYEAVWQNPKPGIYMLYGIVTTGKGNPCITKPCPVVIEGPRQE